MVIHMSAIAVMMQGYLDPGSGSLFLQLLLGGAAGVGIAVRHFWKHFAHLFKSKS